MILYIVILYIVSYTYDIIYSELYLCTLVIIYSELDTLP